MLRHLLVAAVLVSCSSPAPEPWHPPDAKPPPPKLQLSFPRADWRYPVGFPIELFPSAESCDGTYCHPAGARIVDARISGYDDIASVTFTSDRVFVKPTAPGRIQVIVDAHVGRDSTMVHEYLDFDFFDASLTTRSPGPIPNLAYPVLPGTRFRWYSDTDLGVPLGAIEVTVAGALELIDTSSSRPTSRNDLLEAKTAGIGTFVAKAGPFTQSRTVRVAAPGHVKSVALHEESTTTVGDDTPWMKAEAAPSTIRPGRYGIVLTFDDGSIAVGGFGGIERPHAATYSMQPCYATPPGTPSAAIGCVDIYRAYRGQSPLTIRVGDARADYTVEAR